MYKISDYLNSSKMIVVDEIDEKNFINRLVDFTLSDLNEIAELKDFFSKKNNLSLVDIENGFLLCHARTGLVDNISIHLGIISSDKSQYRKGSHRVFFMIILPDSMSKIYLSIMARISRLISSEVNRDVFYSGNKDAIENLIVKFDS